MSLQDEHVLIVSQVLIKWRNSEYQEFCVVVVIEPTYIFIIQQQTPPHTNISEQTWLQPWQEEHAVFI
jgi:hypothetical protein